LQNSCKSSYFCFGTFLGISGDLLGLLHRGYGLHPHKVRDDCCSTSRLKATSASFVSGVFRELRPNGSKKLTYPTLWVVTGVKLTAQSRSGRISTIRFRLIYRVGWGWPLLTKGACSKSGPKHRRGSFRLGLVLLFIPRPLTRAYRHIHPSDVSFGRRCP